MASVSRLVSKDCSLDRNQPDLRFRANLGAGGRLCTSNGSSGAGDGFEVTKFGHGRVALIVFPRPSKILTSELEAVGLRLNKRPPQIYFKRKKTGGISFNSTLPLTHVDEKLCYQILHEHKIHNAEMLRSVFNRSEYELVQRDLMITM
ncbi:hypothetical protein Syun_001722 [Stephania yunnanensis]|uniref:Uncharacterized protein n=1 Tax=Stephania yunnanensis TaxID=152371 RepID=A0AAP0Q6J9_9MAGN